MVQTKRPRVNILGQLGACRGAIHPPQFSANGGNFTTFVGSGFMSLLHLRDGVRHDNRFCRLKAPIESVTLFLNPRIDPELSLCIASPAWAIVCSWRSRWQTLAIAQMAMGDGCLAKWIELRRIGEPRGVLTEIDFASLPFQPVRIFFVTDVPIGSVRGRHAHRHGQQILICQLGRVQILLRSEDAHELVVVEPDGSGLLLDTGVWAEQRYLESNSTLLVICSHPYDPEVYLDDESYR